MSQPVNAKLAAMIRTLCYREGQFVLSSGKTSTFYVDVKNLALSPEGALAVADATWAALNPREFAGVGGPTLGADPLATALSLAAFRLGARLPAFILRKEPKKHGTSRWIEGRDLLSAGARVLLVEDVVTTGGSSLAAVQRLRDEGFLVDTAVCVLDRQEGGEQALGAAGVRLVPLATLKQVQQSV
jgi:orotate phosphoribosyltransferase